MTNDLDTESRLRSYLQARARAYPEASEPPGPPARPGARRRWPVMLAAAAVVAVLAVSVSAVRLLDRGEPAGTGSDGPALPYVLISGDSATLHDRDATVRLAERSSHLVLGRVADGWVVRKVEQNDRPPEPGRFAAGVERIGIVDRSGRFSPVGPEMMAAVLSPDRTKVAIVSRVAGDSARMAVFDLASKQEVASIPVHAAVSPAAWNRHGIWFYQSSVTHPVGVYLWRPGQSPQRAGGQLSTDGPLIAAGTTDRMIVWQTRGATWCLRVVEPQPAAPTSLTTVREFCGTGVQPYPLLSPDGRFMALPADGLAVDIDSGTQTRVDLPPGEDSPTDAYAESATTFLVVTQQPAEGTRPTPSTVTTGSGRRTLSFPVPASVVRRCEIASGACSPVLRVPAGTMLHIGAA